MLLILLLVLLIYLYIFWRLICSEKLRRKELDKSISDVKQLLAIINDYEQIGEKYAKLSDLSDLRSSK